jgi:protein tyrosine kinase modulator
MPDSQSEESLSFAQYWDVLRRRRWWVVGGLVIVWSLAWGATWVLPPKYRSETTILIAEPNVPENYVLPNVSSDPQEHLQTLTQQILSRTRLQRIIEDLNLYAAERRRVTMDDVVDQMRSDIKIDLIQTTGRKAELTAFKVSFAGPSAALAQQVATRLTSLFIEENLRARAQQSEQTTNFLENQLQDARARIEQQENRIRQFKGQHLGQLPSQVDTNVSILNALSARIANANEALNRAEQQKLYLSTLLSQYRDMRTTETGTAANPPTLTPPALDAEISRLKMQLADLQTRYTGQHPDLVDLRDRIAKTEKLKAQIEKEMASGKDADSAAADSPTTAQIASQLKANELEISNRKKEIAAAEAEMGKIQARLNSTPVLEQQLADLTRDYDQSRAYYTSLLAKKDQSQLATNLERGQQGEHFAVLDPPTLPATPDFPNRFKFSLAGLVIGLIAGLAACYGREVTDDHIYDRLEVEKLSRGVVLVTIPPATTARNLRAAHLRIYIEFACGAMLLVIVAGSTVLAYLAYHRG